MKVLRVVVTFQKYYYWKEKIYMSFFLSSLVKISTLVSVFTVKKLSNHGVKKIGSAKMLSNNNPTNSQKLIFGVKQRKIATIQENHKYWNK